LDLPKQAPSPGETERGRLRRSVRDAFSGGHARRRSTGPSGRPDEIQLTG
jgi:hypothetical protein